MRKLWNKRFADLTVGDMTKASVYSYVATMLLIGATGLVLEQKAKRREKRMQQTLTVEE